MDADLKMTQEPSMLTEVEAETILRKADRKRRAREVLAKPNEPRWLYLLGGVGAPVLAQFAFRGFEAPTLAIGLLVGMFTGLVIAAVQIWGMQKRLEAITTLIELEHNGET